MPLGPPVLAGAHGHRLVPATVAGACNLGGTAIYADGGEIGQVAIVSALSALFPLVPILGGVLLFHERLGRLQITGIAIALAGLMLLRPA